MLKTNIENNSPKKENSASKVAKHPSKVHIKNSSADVMDKIEVLALDWESSLVSSLPAIIATDSADVSRILGAVIACDCIYNEALIAPLVQTCAEICQLADADPAEKPTLCIVAQQLRSDTVFENWLKAFHKLFKVWRLPDNLLTDGLKEGSGFAVHVGILRKGAECH